jgi:hypothetical protein
VDCDLEVFYDGRLVRRLKLGADVINIGRDETNEIVLPSAAVAEAHARVVSKGNRYILTDISGRGTYMRGQRVVTTQIAIGDEFYIGQHVFRVVSRDYPVHESASNPPPAPPPIPGVTALPVPPGARTEAAAGPVAPRSNPGGRPLPVPSAPAHPSTPPMPQIPQVASSVPASPLSRAHGHDAAVMRSATAGTSSTDAPDPARKRITGKTPVLSLPPAPIDLSGLIGVLDVKPLLEALLAHTLPAFRAGRGVVMLVDGTQLSPVIARAGASSPVQESFSKRVCQRAVTEATTVCIPNRERSAPALLELAEGTPAALMALPLVSAERPVGVLYLECDGSTPPAWHDRAVLDAVSKLGGRALAAALEHEALAARSRRTQVGESERKRIRPLGDVLAEREREHIEAMLERAGGQLADAARLLGINRQTLQGRMRKLGIRLPKD